MSDTPSPFVEHPLSPCEQRILGSLIEKQATTPETYPLTLNALQLACNQKTSREPVMNLELGELGAALRALENRELVRLVMGSRADRWEQRLDKALQLAPPQLALLGLLLLRGPQTLGELLTRSARLHAFDELDDVRHPLERLAARGLACQLPRQIGQREERYMHCLGSAETLTELALPRTREDSDGEENERIVSLEVRLAELEARLTRLEAALGGN